MTCPTMAGSEPLNVERHPPHGVTVHLEKLIRLTLHIAIAFAGKTRDSFWLCVSLDLPWEELCAQLRLGCLR